MNVYNHYFDNLPHCTADYTARRPNAIKDEIFYRKIFSGNDTPNKKKDTFLKIMEFVFDRYVKYTNTPSWMATYGGNYKDQFGTSTSKWFIWPSRKDDKHDPIDNIWSHPSASTWSSEDAKLAYTKRYNQRSAERENYYLDFFLEALRFTIKDMDANKARMYTRAFIVIAIQESAISTYISVSDLRVEHGMLTISPVQDGVAHNGFENLYDPRAMASAFVIRFAFNLEKFKKAIKGNAQFADPDAVLAAQYIDYAQGSASGGAVRLGQVIQAWKNDSSNANRAITIDVVKEWVTAAGGTVDKPLKNQDGRNYFAPNNIGLYKSTLAKLYSLTDFDAKTQIKAKNANDIIVAEIDSGKNKNDGSVETKETVVTRPSDGDDSGVIEAGSGSGGQDCSSSCQNFKPWL